jgi:hypothetical protein
VWEQGPADVVDEFDRGVVDRRDDSVASDARIVCRAAIADCLDSCARRVGRRGIGDLDAEDCAIADVDGGSAVPAWIWRAMTSAWTMGIA